MNEGVLEAIGGLGLFLLGMFVMTDGLKQLAGRSLRTALRRFTRSPTSGAVTGAVSTAIIQSSSATTVTAVGFVGAGLLTFGEALGIIFGANIGTTITGWLVALFGFKVPLGTLAFPIVLGGSLGRLFLRGRWAKAAEAIAGFGVIFIGIGLLQSGLGGLEGTVTPESFPPNTWFGRLQLVGIGVLITLVTQSSSAGVAIAIAAVHAGTITFPQAAAVVIGMDIGTTVTAAMAVVGGGTQVKRTGLAHVVYNGMTGVGAFFLLVPYVAFWERVGSDALENQPEILLVAFHTLFNGIGVLLVLPVANRFARLIERIIPVPEDDLTHALGRSLLSDADAALDVVEETLRQTAIRTYSLLLSMWRTPAARNRSEDEITELDEAVGQIRAYTTQIESPDSGGAQRARHQAAFHVTDHLDRMLGRLRHTERVATAAEDPELRALAEPLIETTEGLLAWMGEEGPAVTERAEHVSDEIVAAVRPYRAATIERSAGRPGDPADIESRLDSVRFLARVSNHLWRTALYFEQLADPTAPELALEVEPDV
ncbi:MAG: Na/Pi cotransporter family protein [Acidimicrobiales bacterium]|nr:Na/Pi cotransporter family protein [Acidimicrobiales bacterium]